VRIAEAAARSILDRVSSTTETWIELKVFYDLILPRLEGLVQAIEQENRDAATEHIQVLEQGARAA
jgi:hypothetical protein